MANYFVLPQSERTKTGFEAFTEAFQPGLDKAFQLYLQNKMTEMQRQQNLEELGIGKQELTSTGRKYAAGQLRTIEGGAPIQAEMPTIPEKYYKTVLDIEKMKQLPAGIKIPLGYGTEYTAPDTFKREKEERIIKNQDLARANQLRREFIDRPEIKEFITVKNKVKSMEALANSSNKEQSKLAIDQALITLFNKITDPNSVVRESEYERTPHNLSLANRFSGAIEKWKRGGAGLTDEDRQSLVFGAKIMTNELGKMYNEKLSQYSDIATSYGVEPSLITTGIDQYSPYNLNPQLQGQENQPSGWTPEKEIRYQELLKKRGK